MIRIRPITLISQRGLTFLHEELLQIMFTAFLEKRQLVAFLHEFHAHLYITSHGNPALHRGVIVSPTDYTRFVVNYDHLNLESQNQAKNIPVVLPSFPIKI